MQVQKNTSERLRRKAQSRNKEGYQLYDFDDFLGKIQNTFISAADVVLKKNFRNKNNLKKCKQQKWYNSNCQQMRK